MGLPGLIITVTLVTLISIFSFYKFVLEKPQPKETEVSTQTSAQSLESSPGPGVVSSSPSPKVSPTKSSAPVSSPKPSKSPQPSSQPAVTQLSNNISSQTSGVSTISGTIYINGTPPSGTSVVIAAREHGTNNPSQVVVSGITAQTGTSWNWSSAKTGVTYDMVAVLKGKSGGVDVDYANSPTYNLTAPTQSFLMTLNVGYTLPAPTGTITVTCHTHYSNNTWYATVNFPAVSGALMYWFKIGTTSGGTEITNITKNAQTEDVTFNDSATYYAQYAVSTVSTPTQVQYSDFSSPQIVRCP